MRSDRVLETIDFHTAGIGMRLLTSGLGRLPGSTIAEKRRWFQEHQDHLRTALCLEPRGHRPAATTCRAARGRSGPPRWPGLVERTGAETQVLIDTEAGPVETIVRSAGDRVREVTLRWAPSFVALPEQVVEVDGVGEVPVDVAIGVGNVFAIVEAKHLGVSVRRELAKRIAQRVMAVRHAVNAQLRVEVPGLGKTSVDNVLVHELPDADGVSPNARGRGGVLRASSRHRSPSGHEDRGAASDHRLESAVAAGGQADQRLPAVGGDLPLVSRRARDIGLSRGPGVPRGARE